LHRELVNKEYAITEENMSIEIVYLTELSRFGIQSGCKLFYISWYASSLDVISRLCTL
jgi:hypothetical protein